MNNLYEYCDRLNSPIEAFCHVTTPDNFPILPHWHYFIEIIHILDGDAEVTCDDYVYVLHPGDLIVLCPKMIHSICDCPADVSDTHGLVRGRSAARSPLAKSDVHPQINAKHGAIYPLASSDSAENIPETNGNVKYQVLKFDLSYLTFSGTYKTRFLRVFSIAFKKNPEYIYFSKEMLKNFPIYNIFQECINEINQHQYNYDIVVCSQIAMLISYLNRVWFSTGLDINELLLDKPESENIFDNITEYIEQHYNEQIQVADLAEKCGMSYSNFARLFKQTYNQTCKEYIEFIRLNKVEDLLLFTKFDLNYISQDTGFSDCSHLIRSFKQRRGMTPKQWRQAHKKGD